GGVAVDGPAGGRELSRLQPRPALQADRRRRHPLPPPARRAAADLQPPRTRPVARNHLETRRLAGLGGWYSLALSRQPRCPGGASDAPGLGTGGVVRCKARVVLCRGGARCAAIPASSTGRAATAASARRTSSATSTPTASAAGRSSTAASKTPKPAAPNSCCAGGAASGSSRAGSRSATTPANGSTANTPARAHSRNTAGRSNSTSSPTSDDDA